MQQRQPIHGLIQAQFPLVLALTLSSSFSVAMVIVRMVYSDRMTYYALPWNLFLAWVPLLFALALWSVAPWKRRPRGLGVVLVGAWLLFFPNAPYMVTDLIHLNARDGVPIWYDALMIFSFAWNGLLLGFTSLWIVQRVVERKAGVIGGWLLVGATFLASGFGVYLGRFQRWNSWDVVTAPGALLDDVSRYVLNPLAHPRTLVVTMLFAGCMLAMYVTLAVLFSVQNRYVSAAPRSITSTSS